MLRRGRAIDRIGGQCPPYKTAVSPALVSTVIYVIYRLLFFTIRIRTEGLDPLRERFWSKGKKVDFAGGELTLQAALVKTLRQGLHRRQVAGQLVFRKARCLSHRLKRPVKCGCHLSVSSSLRGPIAAETSVHPTQRSPQEPREGLGTLLVHVGGVPEKPQVGGE